MWVYTSTPPYAFLARLNVFQILEIFREDSQIFRIFAINEDLNFFETIFRFLDNLNFYKFLSILFVYLLLSEFVQFILFNKINPLAYVTAHLLT
jgi:hypothetical protein